MPYETRYRTVRTTIEQNLGYDLVPVCRPRFVFFQFVGLRPSTPHWIFFDGVEVTKWVNTSYTLEDFNNSSRNSTLRTPGEQFVNATSFPASLGGPTAASGPINSDATGKLEGVFYLQSNASLSFKIGRRILSAIDISVLNKNDCLSYAEAEYSAIGEYQLYYTYTQTTRESYSVWVDPPPDPDPPDNDNSTIPTIICILPKPPIPPITPTTPITPIDDDKGDNTPIKTSSNNNDRGTNSVAVHTVATTTSNKSKDTSSAKNNNKQDTYEGGPFAGAPVSAGPSTITTKTTTSTSTSSTPKNTTTKNTTTATTTTSNGGNYGSDKSYGRG